MGSYCALLFDKWEIVHAKSVVPDELCALFQDSDLIVTQCGDTYRGDDIKYVATREVILDRLNLFGCTAVAVNERFEIWLEQKRADLRGPDKAAINKLTFSAWRARIPNVLRTQWSRAKPKDAIERRMRDDYAGWLWFDGPGSLLNVRALLDACPEVRTIGLDISDLVGGGWIEPGAAICASRRIALGTPRPLAPTVVLQRAVQTSECYNSLSRRCIRS
jgi:HEPN/Toprim N-terminal domain 1